MRSGEARSQKARDFLRDLGTVCAKHGLVLGHEDEEGAFIVEPFTVETFNWMQDAAEPQSDKPSTGSESASSEVQSAPQGTISDPRLYRKLRDTPFPSEAVAAEALRTFYVLVSEARERCGIADVVLLTCQPVVVDGKLMDAHHMLSRGSGYRAREILMRHAATAVLEITESYRQGATRQDAEPVPDNQEGA